MYQRLSTVIIIAVIFLSCAKEDITEIFDTDTLIMVPVEPPTIPTVPENVNLITELQKTSNWVSKMQQPLGLIESSENANFVSLYDNALAAILFIREGEIARAENILDYFDTKVETELLNGSGGFYQYRNAKGENGNRTWMGDNAWLLVAINQYRQATGNDTYQFMADGLENWLRTLQDEDGGLWGGLNEDGTQIPKVTEGIITAFNAVAGYDDFHRNILSFLKNQRWVPESNSLVAWPENPNYNYALDLHALGFMIFENFPENTLLESQRYLNTQSLTVSGEEITGYCFDEDKDVIWLEGTAQMAVAFGSGGLKNDADALLTQLEKSFITSTVLDNAKGLPYTSNYGTSYGSTPLWYHADIAPALSSTIWYLFAKTEFNPLALGKVKNIPEVDKFWIQK
jgi:hypothetical protein